MSIEKDVCSYIGTAEVLSWGTMSPEKSTVRVGKYCSLAQRIKFYVDGNHRYDHASSFPFYELGYYKDDERNRNCWGKGAAIVGHDVWIGNDVTVMSGVTIGHGSVIGAHAVVTKDVPPYAIVAGNPASVIKYRFPEDMIQAYLEVQWWDLPKEDVLQHLAPLQYDPQLFLDKARELYLSNSKEEEEEEKSKDSTPSLWKRIHIFLGFKK